MANNSIVRRKAIQFAVLIVASAALVWGYLNLFSQPKLSRVSAADLSTLPVDCLRELKIKGTGALLIIDSLHWHEVVLTGFEEPGSIEAFATRHNILLRLSLDQVPPIEVTKLEGEYGMNTLVADSTSKAGYLVFTGDRAGIKYIWMYYCPENGRFGIRLKI